MDGLPPVYSACALLITRAVILSPRAGPYRKTRLRDGRQATAAVRPVHGLMAVVSPRGDGIWEEIWADARTPRRAKITRKITRKRSLVKLTWHPDKGFGLVLQGFRRWASP
jgi:hypothetical protein